MNYVIVETGSKGNAVIFNDVVMVDCGVSFKKLTPYCQKLQIVLLTHIHGDHFNKATIRRLAMERPTLRFVSPEWLIAPLVECGVNKKNIDLCIPDVALWYECCDVLCFETEHDVPNCGYKLWFEIDETTVVYATDTCTLPDYWRLQECDYYFIEANYKNLDELAERVRTKTENGEFIYEDRLQERHLSEEYALNWLVKNGKPSSKHVFLHEHAEKERQV